MPLGDKVRQLDEQVAAVVRRAVEDLREEVRKRLDEATADLRRTLGEVAPELPDSFVSEEDLQRFAEEAAAPSREALSDAEEQGARTARAALREAAARLDRATSQGAILDGLLAESARFAPRAAILLARDGAIAGWDARGFEADRDAARAVSLSGEDEPWRTIVQGGSSRTLPAGRCASLVSQLDSPLPADGVLIPLVLRDRVAALLYADRMEADEPIDPAALQLLTYAAGLALETLALRERSSTVTLHPAEEAGALAADVSAAEAEPEWEAEGEEEELEELAVAETEADAAPAATLEAEEPEGEAAEPTAPAGEGAEEPESAWQAGDETWGEEPSVDVAATSGSFEPVETLESVEEPDEIEAVDELEIVIEGAEELAPSSDLLQPVEEEESEPVARPVAGFESMDERVLEEGAFAGAPELEEAEPGLGAEEEAAEPQDRGEAIPWRTEEPEPFEPEEVEPEEVEAEPEEVEVEEEEAPAAEEALGEPEVELEAAPAPEEATEAAPEAAEAEQETGAELADRPEAGAVPPPVPRPPSIGQVEPPADVEGPGWAFSSSRVVVSKDEEAAHEEARRLARLLVSEIQLYNQDEVEEGRRNRDIYERLRDDIDRSRQLYEDRVEPSVRDSTDYFYQELVRQLAAGDAKALGI